MSYNVNVPFSWELKPGVSKVTYEEGDTRMKHVTVNLPPPPCLSKSARFCVNDLTSILPLCSVPTPPSSSEKKSNGNKKKKQEDPFVAAFRKCTEYTMNGKLSTDDKNDYCKNRTKKNMFILSCKYSCNVRSCNDKSVSVLEGRTERKKRVDTKLN
ncbi:Detected protein of unknown function [Hibiscus syriacus]|uniref:Uncharacterized protein n=1 Tax=Hibiscus syriacus TaxID=106335 RepID=A0A6A2ZW92_HIBSY|nr:Detected protein of unknown function [Hibiscus syriacus]